jgi:hypothetical protein
MSTWYTASQNHVTEETGLKAYVLYTQAAVGALDLHVWAETLPRLTEQFEHVGEVEVYIQDMHAVWEENRDQVRIFVKREEAALIVEETFPLDQIHMWDYVTKPEYKAIFAASESANVLNMKNGRIGVGSAYLCAHGDNDGPQIVVDWQPFEQYTYTGDAPLMGMQPFVTIRVIPVEDRANVAILIKLKGGNPIVMKILDILGKIFLYNYLTRLQRNANANLRAQIEKDNETGVLFRPEAAEVNLEEIGKSIREALATRN